MIFTKNVHMKLLVAVESIVEPCQPLSKASGPNEIIRPSYWSHFVAYIALSQVTSVCQHVDISQFYPRQGNQKLIILTGSD